MTAWLLDPLAYDFMQRALITSVLVGVICAVMGSYLIVKRWALLGDAISHAVLPGVVIAYILGIPFFIGAVVTGLLTALGIGYVERNTRIKADAAMGIMFIGAFALGLALISRVRGFLDIHHILFGNVLGVRDSDLWLAAATGGLVLAVVALLYKELLMWSFDPTVAQVYGLPVRGLHYLMMLLLAVTIVASLQAVGIVLVVAMLITPASTAFLLTRRFNALMGLAVVLGVVASVAGLYLSYYVDVASGAAMVLFSTALFALAMLFSPQEGLIWQALRRRRRASRVAREDALKALHELREQGAASVADLAAVMGGDISRARALARQLRAAGLAAIGPGDAVELTEEGLRQARGLVRTHRLWERFLTDAGGRPWDLVHHEAHGLEHYTSPQVTEELAARLGHPAQDPHGAPIPSAEGTLPEPADKPLTEVETGVAVRVSRIDDENPRVLRTLARLGIGPGTVLTPLPGSNGRVAVRVDGEEFEIDGETARGIRVGTTGEPA
ncbi:MAG TPA: metal ABC transporter permease [Bacillota bacterium]